MYFLKTLNFSSFVLLRIKKFNPVIDNVLMVQHTLKILEQILQDF